MIEPRQRDIEVGQTIIRQGEIATPLQFEALEQLGLRQSQIGWGNIGGAFMIAVVFAVLLGLYLRRFESELLAHPRNVALLLLLLLIFLIIAKLIVPNRTVLPFLFPAAALSMLIAVMMGTGLALTTTIVLAGLVGIL